MGNASRVRGNAQDQITKDELDTDIDTLIDEINDIVYESRRQMEKMSGSSWHGFQERFMTINKDGLSWFKKRPANSTDCQTDKNNLLHWITVSKITTVVGKPSQFNITARDKKDGKPRDYEWRFKDGNSLELV